MSLEQFSNNASTTLGGGISSTATTITVAAGTGNLYFPTLTGQQFFTATIFAAGTTTLTPTNCEIVKVTARSGDTMTVVRGQENTTASAWSTGAIFANFPTAGFLNTLSGPSDIQSQTGNAAGDVGTQNAGSIFLNPAITSLSSIYYSPIRVGKIASANTGAYTLNVNGLGAKSVLLNGQPLQAGQLAASNIFEVAWDGSNFELLSEPAQIFNSNLAPMAANTVKANLSGSPAAPSDIGISALLAGLGFGASSQTANGYATIPVLVAGVQTEIILQWASVSGTVNSSQTYSFPIPFPNACLFCDGAYKDNTSVSNGGCVIDVSSISASQYRTTWIVNYNTGGAGDSATIKMWAVGF